MNVQPTHEKIDHLFEHFTKPGSPGCAVAIARDGEPVYQQGYGLANLELGVPVLPSTVFNIGSMAKQFTAFAIALLEAEGKLTFDEDIRKFLPEIHDQGTPITVRHLIHHTSGLRGTFPELLALAEWRDTDYTTSDDVFWLLKQQQGLNFSPGQEYQYVNSNYILLAKIVERLSGDSFGAFCKSRIFEPLGMERSTINDSVFDLIPGRALGYYQDQGEFYNAPLTDSVVGPTNVYTTVEDLLKWDDNFNTAKVGGPAVVAQIQQPGQLADGTVLDYAFGLMVGPKHRHQGWQLVEHGGSQGGYSTWMLRFPENRLSVVVLFNLFMWEMREYALKVADLFLEETSTHPKFTAQESPPPSRAEAIELDPVHLENKAGVYFDEPRAALREIKIDQGRLQYQGLDLLPESEDRFFFKVEPETRVEFLPDGGGGIAAMRTISASGVYRYERVESQPPSAAELDQYAGRYYSPELQVTWNLAPENGGLVASRRKYVDSKLTPVFRDAFRDDWSPLMGYPTFYLVVFERDAEGSIQGLTVSGTRVRNLRFVRQSA